MKPRAGAEEEARPAWGSLAWLALLFALSGAAALIIEIVWQRWFRLLLGATAPATSATLVAFFAGQAVGAVAGARLAARRRDPLRLYGWVELAAAACAAAVPLLLGAGEVLLRGAYDGLLQTPAALVTVRFALALGVSLPASLAFGASFPAVVAAAMPDSRRLGSRGAALYAANLLGAVLGALLGSFVLPEWLGVPVTYALALALSASAGVGALLASRAGLGVRSEASGLGSRDRPVQRGALAVGPRRLLAFAILSGFGAFALQVLLVHAFGLVLNQSVYAFGLVLVLVLVSLALGAGGAAVLDHGGRTDPRPALAFALTGAALAIAAVPFLLVEATSGLEYVGTDAAFPAYLLAALRVAGPCAAPALLAAGFVFPLTLALAGRTTQRSAARAAGSLLAANTAGALAGALVAPFLLLPWLGPWLPFLALAALYAGGALLVPLPGPRWRLRRDIVLGLGWLLVLARANPISLPVVGVPGEELLHLEHSAAGTVAVALREGERLLQVDNHYSLGGTGERARAERQGHLPLLLVPRARRVAYLGSATGISAGAATQHPVERIVTVELVPGVAEAARRFFRDANQDVLEDPRTEVVVDDARNFLRLTSEHFDVIVSDLFVPWRAGTGSLYTVEHFAAARDRLTRGGVFCQWLALYQLSEREFRTLAASFLDVFPETSVFRGDFYGRFPIVALCGWRDGPPAPEAVHAAVRRLRARGDPDRWLTDPVAPWPLYVGRLDALRATLEEVPRQSDGRPVLEFWSGRGSGGGAGSRGDALVGLAWARVAETLRRADDPMRLALPPEARGAMDGGAALQAAGAFYSAGREEEAGQALAAAAGLLPRRLLADAPADPTAAEVWTD
ncbi:MAG: hypothetical protein ABFS46_03830 [Myxococcota bacterium]